MEIMKQESCENELQFHVDTNDDQSWSPTALKTPTIPFSNFYITKGPSSNCSGSHHKLSEQLT
ncbi:unnamed protein product, partial [Adineta steineri]